LFFWQTWPTRGVLHKDLGPKSSSSTLGQETAETCFHTQVQDFHSPSPSVINHPTTSSQSVIHSLDISPNQVLPPAHTSLIDRGSPMTSTTPPPIHPLLPTPHPLVPHSPHQTHPSSHPTGEDTTPKHLHPTFCGPGDQDITLSFPNPTQPPSPITRGPFDMFTILTRAFGRILTPKNIKIVTKRFF
jgi:hypothetical protein